MRALPPVIIMLMLLVITRSVRAEGVHMRAREHYEVLTVKGYQGGFSARYAGLSNTINLWYEKPFHYAVGIAASPLWATLPIVESDPPPGTGKRIRLVHIGLEGKYFPLPKIFSMFSRVGVFHAQLQSAGQFGVVNGLSYLIAFGYEWNISGVGLAPEMALRGAFLEKGVQVQGIAPAIGVHFYKLI